MRQRITSFAGTAFLPITVIGFPFHSVWLLYEEQGAKQRFRLLTIG
jgi:hypothetical protein